MRRRAFLAAVAGSVGAVASLRARADEATVPAPVQAQLLTKVAAYDKNFAARAGARAQVLVVVQSGNDESTRMAAALLKELGSINAIGGLPHDDGQIAYSGAASLAATIKKRKIAIVILAPGLGDEIDAVRAALDGVDVLSVATVDSWVPRGIVLGFDLVSGKPKLLVHLGQAKKQHVAFKAEVLKLMRIYE